MAPSLSCPAPLQSANPCLTYTNPVTDLYSYDQYGNMTLHTDPNGNKTQYVYAGQPTGAGPGTLLTEIDRAFGTGQVESTFFSMDG